MGLPWKYRFIPSFKGHKVSIGINYSMTIWAFHHPKYPNEWWLWKTINIPGNHLKLFWGQSHISHLIGLQNGSSIFVLALPYKLSSSKLKTTLSCSFFFLLERERFSLLFFSFLENNPPSNSGLHSVQCNHPMSGAWILGGPPDNLLFFTGGF